ncbi:MAG: hypothetical protein AUJ04_01025 [Acidobacteria bacterium 13_1_40CM_3_55_6]|nr:MAG: hypothetical protein AUJ04_01025 [Acidobacteria bacterium 13_1_40CM_3_55_6]
MGLEVIITSNNICYYLIDRGLVDPASVVEGDFMVVETTRRNRNFKVIRRNHPSFFVKQIQNWDPQTVATLQCEATCYWLAHSNPEMGALAALMPNYYFYDPGRHVLITQLLKDGENISEYHRRLNQFPESIAAQLGRALGTYHSETLSKLGDGPGNSVFSKRVPWILSINQQEAHLFQALSAANSQLFSIVRSYPEFNETLDELRDKWRFDSLIHGDMKWDNLVVSVAEENGKGESVKIVDWELADIGDARWDVGAILQSYLSFWILSIPPNAEANAEQLERLAQYPLEPMQPAIRAFWKTYIATRQIGNEEGRQLLESCVKFGAARMIQTAYEYMQYSPQISASALYLLQVSLNTLKSPKEAISDLLSL